MFLSVLAPESGILTHEKPEGTVVEAGDLVGRLLLDEPDKVKKAELYDEVFPEQGEPNPVGSKANVRLDSAIAKLHRVLEVLY